MDAFLFLTQIGWVAGLCLFFGLLLTMFEIFIPGFGIPGLFGLSLLVVGVALTAQTIEEVLIMSVLILVILGIALAWMLRSASRGKLSRNMILSSALKKEEGYVGTDDFSAYMDREGTAITVLRPAGTAEFEGVKLDVVSEAEFIPKGSRVRVIEVVGRRVVVRPIA